MEIESLNPDALLQILFIRPWKLHFCKERETSGNPILGGLGMLLHQAVRGFELWFGVKPEVTAELYELVAADVQKAQQAMISVGLTGSIATGKSEVAKLFSGAGIPVFDSDAEVHDLYVDGKITGTCLARTFPEVIVDGKIDRQRLGQRVLGFSRKI